MSSDESWANGSAVGPLTGVRVVEIAGFMSVPFAAMMLADLGAEVVKVEPPRGDPFRRFGRPRQAMSAVFANVNRGKRSVALDLKDESDRAHLLAVLREADVVLSNWRPGVAGRLGLDDDVLASCNPRLVRVYVSGFGAEGPDAAKPAFDSVIQARSGMAWAQGDDQAPALTVGYLVDKLTAAMAAQATLAALYERTRTGQGVAIDLSMFDATAYIDFPELLAMRTFVDDEPGDARNRQMSANRPLRAADGWLVVTAVTGDQVRGARAALGRPDWADELMAERDGARLTARLAERIESQTRARTVAECLDVFERHDVPAAECVDPDEHLADAQTVHGELYEIVEHPTLGRVREVRYPARWRDRGLLRGLGRAPLLDADRERVLGSP